VIRVEPATLAWVEALAEGDDVFEQRFGVPVVAGWAPFPEAMSSWLEPAPTFGS
jgi:hypothetical protein